MSSYIDEDGFRWHCANLQVFHEDNRIAIYEATPGIGLYGGSHGIQLPFNAATMYDLVEQAERLFPIELDRLMHPQR